MSSNLKIDWCSFEAAEIAVKHWHYSQRMPAGKLTKFGVWEDGEYIGCILYGRGANNNISKSYGLQQTECVELVRIALKRGHKVSVSKVIAISMRMLKKFSPGLMLIVSYADMTNQKHLGTVYQASNWIYLGTRTTGAKGAYYVVNGVKMHGRSVRAKWGSDKNIPGEWSDCPPETKHLYIYPLNVALREKYAKIAKPYPKRVEHENNAATFQDAEGGAVPTNAHQAYAEA